ncbi:MAG: efflux RND transporter periplasmic adaptor subunit [Bacteroidetes bacterium]|nr:efflux RND transporter periplasmic adaptor subunit [Bacteroidota bacterium]
MNKKILFYLLPVGILLGGYVVMQLLAGMKEEPRRRMPASVAKSVHTEVVTMRETEATVEALGKLTSSQPVQLISEATGTILRGDVAFMPGQRFRKGDLLLRIDDRQPRYSLSSTKSDFLNALAAVLPELKIDFPGAYAEWQNYFDSVSFDTALEPLPEAGDRKIKLLLTRFNVYKLYFSIKNLEVALEKHFIHAPFDGSIVSTAQREGSSARNGSLLGEIISLENLELALPVPATDIAWIDASKPVRLSTDELPGGWTGRITRIGSTVDQRTQTVAVYVTVQGNIGQLYEGLFLRAEIPGTVIPSATEVPRRALYEERFVYVVDNGRLQRRDVTITRRKPTSVIVSEGLSTGDTLVTELLQGVSPGMPVVARLAQDKGETE